MVCVHPDALGLQSTCATSARINSPSTLVHGSVGAPPAQDSGAASARWTGSANGGIRKGTAAVAFFKFSNEEGVVEGITGQRPGGVLEAGSAQRRGDDSKVLL